MRIAVCDDELTMLKLISYLVRNEFESRGENVSVSSYPGARMLLNDIPKKSFDAVLLDIKMPDTDGFKAAQTIKALSPASKIIFITTEEGLVFDSFEFQPFSFIPKTPPEVMKSRLSRTIENLLSALSSSRKICVKLPYNDKIYIKPDELVYVKSDKNNLFYHLENGEEIIARAKLQEAEEILPDELFVRIHNRTIVNMKHIAGLDCTHSFITVTGGTELAITRTYKTDFEAAYDKFIRGHL